MMAFNIFYHIDEVYLICLLEAFFDRGRKWCLVC
jgi:hypothetical protein